MEQPQQNTANHREQFYFYGSQHDKADSHICRSDDLWDNSYLNEMFFLSQSSGNMNSKAGRKKFHFLIFGRGCESVLLMLVFSKSEMMQSVTLSVFDQESFESAKRIIVDQIKNAIPCRFRIEEGSPDEEFQSRIWLAELINSSDPQAKIQICIECLAKDPERLFPQHDDRKYHYIVYNGPYVDLPRHEHEDPRSLSSGLYDEGLKIIFLFVEHLNRYLDPGGVALLNFPDCRARKQYVDDLHVATRNKVSEFQDPLFYLCAHARSSGLAATYLRVSESEPQVNKQIISDAEIYLWHNIIFRISQAGNGDDHSISSSGESQPATEHKHDIASGFIMAAAQIADIYSAKRPLTNELYTELASRLLTIYRIMCDQLGGLYKEIVNDFMISGFSFPAWNDKPPLEYKDSSWTYGSALRSKMTKEARKKYQDEYDRLIDDIRSQELNAALASETLLQSNIFSLEVYGYSEHLPAGFLDENPAAAAQASERQVRFHIQLDKDVCNLNRSNCKTFSFPVVTNYYQRKSSPDLAELRGNLERVLRGIALNFKLPLSVDSGDYKFRYLEYCLYTRYSAQKQKSAVFYLMSTTKHVPFLNYLKTFGQIANTAANTFLSWKSAHNDALKASRTAVFARNFSHIIGSHVISHPGFISRLVDDSALNRIEEDFDKVMLDFENANQLFETKIWSENLVDCWKDGQLTLKRAKEVSQRLAGSHLGRIRSFHDYLQKRFDFIAGAIDENRDHPSPIWFVRDLLSGFLVQTAYLDTIVADIGIRLENMQFSYRFTDGNGQDAIFEYFPNESRWKAVLNKHNTLDETADRMVSLPGGMASAHAFYSLLENILRNSIKYGTMRNRETEKYQIEINLCLDKKSSNTYTLIISDNYSGAGPKNPSDNPLWEKLQRKLERPFVSPEGRKEISDLGLIEMQACAQMLCMPGLDSPPGDPFVLSSAESPSSQPKQSSLRIVKPTKDDEPLKYQLCLQRPFFLLLISRHLKGSEDGMMLSVEQLSKTILNNNWPYFTVADANHIQSLLQAGQRLLAEELDLPYRSFILCNDENLKKTLSDASVDLPRGLRRRVFLDPDAYEVIFSPDTSSQEACLRAYEVWIRHWKNLPSDEHWDLWIGLEREERQVNQVWQERLQKLHDRQSSPLRVAVRSFHNTSVQTVPASHADLVPDQKSESGYWNNERSIPIAKKRAFVFDNHGNCFPEVYDVGKDANVNRATRFYQNFSGALTPKLFRALSNPPQDDFSFAFFIYSLVESCITNVAIVDERFAWSLMEASGSESSEQDFCNRLASYNKIGIYPVFRFRKNGSTKGYYNTVHQKMLKGCLMGGKKPLEENPTKEVLEYEGLTFDESNNAGLRVLCVNDTGPILFDSGNADDGIGIDILLIHEGSLDLLASGHNEWADVDSASRSEQLRNLYDLFPAIIRTSGRGRLSKYLERHWPFIEFSQVSTALLTSRNKLTLVRSLLSVQVAEHQRPSSNPAP